MHGHRQARHAPTWITLTAAGSTTLAEEIERLKLLIKLLNAYWPHRFFWGSDLIRLADTHAEASVLPFRRPGPVKADRDLVLGDALAA